MKKTLIALGVLATVATGAQATNVYDKDGTTLDIGGRIEALWFSADKDWSSNRDAAIRDRWRFNVRGRTKLADGIYGYGFYETQHNNTGKAPRGSGLTTRDAYVGVDFGKFGKLQAGRYIDPFDYVGDITDHFEEDGNMANITENRDSGKISYFWSGYGFDVALTYQASIDALTNHIQNIANVNDYSWKVDNGGDGANIDGGFSIAVGYTTPNVLFGPISIRAAYQYLEGKEDIGMDNTYADAKYSKKYFNPFSLSMEEYASLTQYGNLDDIKMWAVGLSWGTYGKGLYLGTVYSNLKVTYKDTDNHLNYSIQDGLNHTTTVEKKHDLEIKAFESIIGYGWENGVSARVGWQWQNWDNDIYDLDRSLIQTAVSWDINSNFRVWIEAHFDVSKDDDKGFAYYTKSGNEGGNVVGIGARYTF